MGDLAAIVRKRVSRYGHDPVKRTSASINCNFRFGKGPLRVLIFAAILAIFVYGMIAAMLGTILPDLSERFKLTPRRMGPLPSRRRWD